MGKTSLLPPATTPLTGNELVEIEQKGAPKKVAVTELGGGGGGSMVYPGAGIPVSTGSAWGTSIPNGADGQVLTMVTGNWAPADAAGGLPDEEDIEGTALQNSTASGTVTLDLATFIDFRLTLTGNTTIAVGNTPASGKSFVRNLTIVASGTQTLTFPAGWKIYGDYYPSGVRNKITIIFSNFPVAGLEVDCFISQPN